MVKARIARFSNDKIILSGINFVIFISFTLNNTAKIRKVFVKENFHAINFKNTYVTELADLVVVEELHATRSLVEVVTE